MSQRQADPQLADHTAQAIKDAFAAYHFDFKDITRQAKERFEQCDWHGLQKDTEMRLDLYKDYVARAIEAIKPDVAAYTSDTSFWAAVKERYSRITMGRHDLELAESFFNSVTMRLATFTGLDPHVQYVGSEFGPAPSDTEETAFVTCCGGPSVSALIEGILLDCRFNVDFKDLKQDVALVTEQVESYLWESYQAKEVDSIDIARPIFYRGKGAYLVGRVNTASTYVPLVIALFNDEGGVYVDAVLLTEDEVSIIFSFARSYFHVDVETPHALVGFLKAIMPLKPVAELYISLGYNKHGKTELYRDLMRHMSCSTDKFEIARGEKGMVMTVFTLPSYDVVFKVIKDTFDYPKTTTRQEVMNHYHLVFKHDRGGRLVDAQEFEHLRFDKERFSPALLEELSKVASNTVSVEGDQVVIKHLYTERRLDPLNLYVKQVATEAAAETVIDYGQAIKDLAATNIFPGDILLKNFGVTRHGRVVFYDYDELCLLTECEFKEMPQGSDLDEDLFSESWLTVGEQDVFPEELKTFLGLPLPLADTFSQHHGELFGVDFWRGMQERHEKGEVIEVLPYKERKRLPHEEAGAPNL